MKQSETSKNLVYLKFSARKNLKKFRLLDNYFDNALSLTFLNLKKPSSKSLPRKAFVDSTPVLGDFFLPRPGQPRGEDLG